MRASNWRVFQRSSMGPPGALVSDRGPGRVVAGGVVGDLPVGEGGAVADRTGATFMNTVVTRGRARLALAGQSLPAAFREPTAAGEA